MSSWFGSGNSVNIDSKINEATSEAIPFGDIDITIALEITDTIKSKQVPPKDAMRALKKRFLSPTVQKNPNTSKSCLKLIDFCIKNGGEHFVVEIASKEFLDPITALLEDKDLNKSVSEYLLELIQSWSIICSTVPKLNYVNQVYTRLQKEGHTFPAISEFVEPTLIEAMVAPEWEDSDACMLCSSLFTFVNRKHHCRSCGGVFCGTHSSNSCELPKLGINIKVRVCDTCYKHYKDNKAKSKTTHKRTKSTSSKTKSTSNVDDEDEELRKAIELSLKESGLSNGSSDPPIVPKTTSNPSKHIDEEEDEDMKAAIALSLQEFKQQDNSGTNSSVPAAATEPEAPSLYSHLLPAVENTTISTPAYSSVQTTQYPNLNNTTVPSTTNSFQPGLSAPTDFSKVTPVEENNVLLFAQLLDNLKQTPIEQRRPIDNDTVLENLLQTVHTLQNTKLVKNIDDETKELEIYHTKYSKLFAVNQLFDDILSMKLKAQLQTQKQASQVVPPVQLQQQQQQQYSPYPAQQQLQYQSPIQQNSTGRSSIQSPVSQYFTPSYPIQPQSTNYSSISQNQSSYAPYPVSYPSAPVDAHTPVSPYASPPTQQNPQSLPQDPGYLSYPPAPPSESSNTAIANTVVTDSPTSTTPVAPAPVSSYTSLPYGLSYAPTPVPAQTYNPAAATPTEVKPVELQPESKPAPIENLIDL